MRSSHPLHAPTSWLVAGLLVCALAAGCDAGNRDESFEPGPYEFIRSQGLLIRIDTIEGQVWFVPASGDGGWVPLGSRPTDAGIPNAKGRYSVYQVPSKRRGPRSDAAQELVRLDHEAGRTWTITVADGAVWSLVAEPEGGAPPEAMPDADRPVTPPLAARPQGAQSGAGAAAAPAPQFQIMPRERFGETTEEQAKNVQVVLQALHKDGLPVEMKVWAVKQLGVLDAEVAVPPLLESLQSEHPEVVVAAIQSLQQIGQASTIPAILKLQQHPDARVRAAVDATVMEVR